MPRWCQRPGLQLAHTIESINVQIGDNHRAFGNLCVPSADGDPYPRLAVKAHQLHLFGPSAIAEGNQISFSTGVIEATQTYSGAVGHAHIGRQVSALSRIPDKSSRQIEEPWPAKLARLLRVDPRTVLAAGLLTTVASALAGLTRQRPVLTGLWWPTPVPGIGKLSTVLLFDVGVYLVVVGAALLIVLELAADREGGCSP